MKKKSWVTVFVVVLFIGLISACGTSQNNGAPTNESDVKGAPETKEPVQESTEPVELEMAIWGNDAHLALYDEMAAEYNKLHPHVTIKTSVIPWADYQQKLAIMAASKKSPDIVWLAERMIPQFLSADQLLDISSIQGDGDYDFGDIIPSSLSAFQKDGKLHGIPFSTPPQVVFYNKSLFEARGLKTPMKLYEEGNWTYEELEKAAQAISNPSEGVFGVKFIQASSDWAERLIAPLWANGGEIFNDDITAFTMNSPETANAIRYFKNLLDTKAHPSIGEQLTFDTGKLGMDIDNLTRVSKYRDSVNFEWDIAPLPKGEHGVRVPLGFAGYSIFKDTSHPEAALDYLKFVSNKENAARVADFFVPQRSSVLYSDAYLNQSDFPTAETLKIAAYDQIAGGMIRPSHTNWVKIDEVVTINLDTIFIGSTTIEDALKAMEASINPLLK